MTTYLLLKKKKRECVPKRTSSSNLLGSVILLEQYHFNYTLYTRGLSERVSGPSRPNSPINRTPVKEYPKKKIITFDKKFSLNLRLIHLVFTPTRPPSPLPSGSQRDSRCGKQRGMGSLGHRTLASHFTIYHVTSVKLLFSRNGKSRLKINTYTLRTSLHTFSYILYNRKSTPTFIRIHTLYEYKIAYLLYLFRL